MFRLLFFVTVHTGLIKISVQNRFCECLQVFGLKILLFYFYNFTICFVFTVNMLKSRLQTVRHFSKLLHVHPTVKLALENKQPVVALESTLISHGLPYPRNFK